MGFAQNTASGFDSTENVRLSGTPVQTSRVDTSFSTGLIQSERQSRFFTAAEKGKTEMIPEKRIENSTDWITLLIAVLLILIAWAKRFYGKKLSPLLISPFTFLNFNQLLKEGNLFRERISIPLFIVYIISLSLFLYELYEKFFPFPVFGLTGNKLFTGISMGVLFFWLIKNTIINLSGIIFEDYFLSGKILLTNFIFNLSFGLIILPIDIIVVYTGSVIFLYLGIVLLLVLNIYRFLMELLMGISLSKYSLYYKFLYLCTLEILPILVVIKLVLSELS